MPVRRLLLPVLALLLGGSALAGVRASDATYLSSSTTTLSVTAATDWTPPTVTVTDPGSLVAGTTTISASATDARGTVASVVLQYVPSGGTTWTTLCTDTSAPYSCPWTTTSVPDGAYVLRAIATDDSGYAATSDSVTTRVANNASVVLTDPGDNLRATVTLNAAVSALPGGARFAFSYAAAGTTKWTTVCAQTSTYTATASCAWNTSTLTGDFDIRVVATSTVGTTYTDTVYTVTIDNTAPAVTMTDPGSPLSGSATFAATATDADSGVAQVVLQYQLGTSGWTNLCTLTATPYSCRYDTTRLVDGTYGFRAIATDAAGNATTSAVVGNRVVDNTVSSVSMEDPGAYLSGTVTLGATANSTAGVTSVRMQWAPNGSTTWTDVCTDTTSPYTCSWDSTKVADGLYDFRAILVDGSGRTTTSTAVTARRVDNSPLRGADVQTANGAASIGKAENGDTVTFTYNDQVSLSTVTAGWTGSALAVTVRLRDGGLLGLSSKDDTLDVLRAGSTVSLGSLNLREDYIKGGKTATFNATMTSGTATVNGSTVTTVTLRLGTLAGGSGIRTAGNSSNAVWSPSSAVTDLFGKACSTAPVTETGALDKEF